MDKAQPYTPEGPLLSIVVPTYQHVRFIEQCLGSMLMQKTNFPIEILIGEDGSTDGTREICQRLAAAHPGTIRLFLRSRKDVVHIDGKPTGRANLLGLFKEARGKYIAWCDGDDYWTDPLKLQKQVDFLESHPDHVICFHRVMLDTGGILVEDHITEPKFAQAGKRSVDVKDLLRFNNFIHTPTVVFRREALELPAELLRTPMADYLIYVGLMQHGLAHRLEDKMAVYRKGVGIFSALGQVDTMRSTLMMNSCVLAWLKDPQQREILLERHLEQLARYHKVVGHAMADPKVASNYIDFRHALGLLAFKLREKLGLGRTSAS